MTDVPESKRLLRREVAIFRQRVARGRAKLARRSRCEGLLFSLLPVASPIPLRLNPLCRTGRESVSYGSGSGVATRGASIAGARQGLAGSYRSTP